MRDIVVYIEVLLLNGWDLDPSPSSNSQFGKDLEVILELKQFRENTIN